MDENLGQDQVQAKPPGTTNGRNGETSKFSPPSAAASPSAFPAARVGTFGLKGGTPMPCGAGPNAGLASGFSHDRENKPHQS